MIPLTTNLKFQDICLKFIDKYPIKTVEKYNSKNIMTTIEIKETKKLNKEIQVFLKDLVINKKQSGLKEEITFANFLSDKMLIVLAIREGLPYSIFKIIQNRAPFSQNDWAEVLDLSVKSLHRYHQANKRFKSIHSEKIIELAEVTELGKDVFGDTDKFKLWLDTPNFSLGNLKPLELLKDSYGKEMVISELTRIEHGILS